jgi:polysaccharide pyruvyl transferase WcaK-like protein
MGRATIWVEHSAGWGNVGDDALLLSAVRRLEEHLGPADFVLSGRGDGALPARLPPHERISSPQCSLDQLAARLRDRLQPVLRWSGVLPFGMDERSRRVDGYVLRLSAAALTIYWRVVRRLPGRFASRGIARSLRRLEECDVLYVVGDNAFNDFYPAGVVGRRWLCGLARGAGVRVALSSQGFGPLDMRWAMRELKRMLRDVDLLTLRDHSYGRGRVLAVNPGFSARVSADEAFALATSENGAAHQLLERAGIGADDPFIAVNFRGTDCVRDTTELAPRLATLCDRLIAQTEGVLAFFPMSYSTHWGLDLDYAEIIRSYMNEPASLRSVPLVGDVETIKSAIGRARYTFGTSYHMHVFGLSQQRPALVLYTGAYYRVKSEGIAAFYRPAAAAYDIEHTGDLEMLEAAADIERNYSVHAQSIAAVNSDLLRDNDWILRALARTITAR